MIGAAKSSEVGRACEQEAQTEVASVFVRLQKEHSHPPAFFVGALPNAVLFICTTTRGACEEQEEGKEEEEEVLFFELKFLNVKFD